VFEIIDAHRRIVVPLRRRATYYALCKTSLAVPFCSRWQNIWPPGAPEPVLSRAEGSRFLPGSPATGVPTNRSSFVGQDRSSSLGWLRPGKTRTHTHLLLGLRRNTPQKPTIQTCTSLQQVRGFAGPICQACARSIPPQVPPPPYGG
jgi:hypothetical protein